MALSWNEIKDRALKFSKDWEGESRERAEKDTFWNEFFHVFGKHRRSLAIYEKAVKKLNNKQGYIDLFWESTLLVEHKSKGKNLDAAFEQATDYFHGLEEYQLPKYVLVSDFEKFKLYDLDDSKEYEFHISELHNNVNLFGFIAGYQKKEFKEEDPVNIQAAELMGKLHDELEESGYEGHPLEVFLVRLLFCLFAEDTGIFEKDLFREFIQDKTNEDGSDLGAWFAQLFQVLNTPESKRLKNLDEHLNAFPYVNGKLYEEQLPIAAFNSNMRKILLECSSLNWGLISPAIFGSMFQSVMNPQERRDLGAHYTSEKNILKLIKPLFLDGLQEEFKKAKSNKNKLREFHHKLGTLNFLDPACGCGNFLIITYRELRLLELEVLKILYGKQQVIGIDTILHVEVDQFYGIEYDEFPARIAEVALWLMDHQMNLRVSEEFGLYYARLPLKKSATIVHGNALRIEWKEVVKPSELSYILGNPPFYGKQLQNAEQKEDMKLVFEGVKGYGVLDYVSAWYIKASQFIGGTSIKTAFVSTNSITQGEQVPVLWGELFNNYGVKILFAHRTFKWQNEARGNAGVHVVIVGFSEVDIKKKELFDYPQYDSDPEKIIVENINPYLVAGDDVVLQSRSKPICEVPAMFAGSKPVDGGNFILNDEVELNEFLAVEPNAKNYLHKYVGAYEFINNKDRWCLWLKGINPKELRSMPYVLSRVNNVKELRLESKRAATNKAADYPTLFAEDKQPDSDYIIVPLVSSERRVYIPIGFASKEIIASNLVSVIPSDDKYIFGVISSMMHMTWVKNTCGRLESRFRYSNKIVYNNYPWPPNVSEKQKNVVRSKAAKVLEAREKYPENSLAELYDPLTMPPELIKAHKELDKSVDQCYRSKQFTNETSRMEFLFNLYEEFLNL